MLIRFSFVRCKDGCNPILANEVWRVNSHIPMNNFIFGVVFLPLIDELDQADIIVMSSSMYNYGMPAALKAWFDQVIRIHKTFTFDLARGDFPLEPIMSGKTLVLITSSGEFGFEIGGIREKMNHLGPHVQTVSHYLGVETFHEIKAEYQEFNDDRHRQSVASAHKTAAELATELANAYKL